MSTTASLSIITQEDGTMVAKTETRWSRSFGRCNLRHFSRTGEIFTRSRLKAWCKKYKVKISAEELQRFPVSVWWES